ncbi:STAS domain-containing protein [Streptomyces sp. NPDC088785]|uniref:STAS domain-containing protein n=1 Tax=Streptomyces sp. NPDC088785 TaxID=3365897 RepID=UPI00382A64B8
MRASLQVTVNCDPHRSTISLHGDCDEDSEHLLTEALTQVLAVEPRVLEIDVSQVGFGDSTLLHALLLALRAQSDRGARLVLRGPLSAAVSQLLDVTGTTDVFRRCVETSVPAQRAAEQESGSRLGRQESAQ